jgi:hypothetical protein
MTTIKRPILKVTQTRTTKHRVILQFSRKFFASENHMQFAIEAFLVGAMLALCASPIIAAAVAISRVL